MAEHNNVGKRGEEIAKDFLVAKGYAIVDTNARVGHYELDIVALKDNRIIFIEVKTRSNDDDDPLDAIDKKKIHYLCRAADSYVRHHGIPHEVQFDVISIIGNIANNGEFTIEHFPDAFRPEIRSGR